ncbi:MAG: molybdopterin-dependent oxidoreductase [Halobacteriovoraceae bacterium]|nr:molybdopterin-dependent oxidoreductase [Halobacteriovoraceae bacterium]
MSIGKNIKHDSSLAHVTGESIFIDDREALASEVFVGVVGSPVACGTLKKIYSQKALEYPTCLAVYTAKDLVVKKWGAIVHDQPLLVEEEIGYIGEPICIFACSNRYDLEEIKKLFTFDILAKEGVFTLEEALKKNNLLYAAPKPFVQGDIKKGFEESEYILEGSFYSGGQEHFYMESQASVAYPMENGQIEVHSSSQHPSETQRLVAEALGLSFQQVVCIVKRLGGGFGGKESQAAPIAVYAALVASKFNRAARLILTKDEDMKITGKRHPFYSEYKVGFSNEGLINALKVKLNADAGAYLDLSSSILERAMFHADGAYYLQNVHIEGRAFKTNNASNTAYRGFGGPQGNMVVESILEDIALFLKKDSFDIRRLNIYQNKNTKTPYGQDLENNMLPALFDKVLISSDYKKRLTQIEHWNNKKYGSLKGISITAVKFGIAFTARFLNQGSALVNLHLDGSLQVSTGAIEMGQGINTKLGQIVAHCFGVSCDVVQVMTTSTEKNHNTSPTAASSGSDINGAAALQASNQIKARLTKLAQLIFKNEISDDLNEFELGDSNLSGDIVFVDGQVKEISSGKKLSLKELIQMAYFNRVSLGGYSFYKTPEVGFSKETVEGKAFNYYTQGVAVSEVIVDEYTGEVKVTGTDILMDLGRPLNPGIDKGQTTGAFIQGMGWVTTEKLVYDNKGNLLTHSPTTYKIPNIQDTPRTFNVDFICNEDNQCNVHRSKAVGEPPFLLGISVWTAIKHALSFRNIKNINSELTSPATNETVLVELMRLKGV